jgi:hypothetical protein
MRINPQSFFSFCAGHVALLRRLAERAGDLSEAECARLIREHAAQHEELPETTWRRLKELQIVVPSEPGGSTFLLAEPVARLLTYLFDEANPATPEMVRGYVESLQSLCRKLSTAIDSDDVTYVGLAFNEINTTLRRIHADLEETQRAVQNEVASFKVNPQQLSARQRYRRIVYWMERFIEPMVDIVRPDGPMAGAFEQTEQLLARAREQSLFNDNPALDRNLRYLRLIRHHALRVFQDCRKELQPLYESLRRSSLIAEGAALALERLQKDGLALWGVSPLVQFCQLRFHQVPGDGAISLSLRRVIESPPAPPPVINLAEEEEVPAGFIRRLWLESLPGDLASNLPVSDLLEWLINRYPSRSTADLVGGFTRVIFEDRFSAEFSGGPTREYPTSDGALVGSPVKLEKA